MSEHAAHRLEEICFFLSFHTLGHDVLAESPGEINHCGNQLLLDWALVETRHERAIDLDFIDAE